MPLNEDKKSHIRYILMSDLIDKAKFLIKFRWHMVISDRNAEIGDWPGSFYVSLSPRQKFYGNTSLTECPRDELNKFNIANKRTIHLGNLIFMNAQLYVITSETVMRLRDPSGLLLLRTSTKERSRILKEINSVYRRKRRW